MVYIYNVSQKPSLNFEQMNKNQHALGNSTIKEPNFWLSNWALRGEQHENFNDTLK